MKNRAFAAAVVVAAFPSVACAADSAQFSVTVTAHVGAVCNWVTGGNDIDLMLSGFVDTDARIRGNTRNSTLGRMACNEPSVVSIKTEYGGLKSDHEGASCTVGNGGDSYCVNYTATATWDDTSVTYTTDGSAGHIQRSELSPSGGSKLVQISITPQKPTGDVPLVAGDFTDTLTVQLGPPM